MPELEAGAPAADARGEFVSRRPAAGPDTGRRPAVIVAAIAIGAVLLLTVAACGDEARYTVARSKLAREPAPVVTEGDRDSLQAGGAAFAFDLYGELASDTGNLAYSPYSISTALAMTLAGARGSTKAEMSDVLNFELPEERLHPALNAVAQALEARREVTLPSGAKPETPPELTTANAVWADRQQTVLPEFLDVLAVNYGAGLNLVDFIGAPEEAREAINAWVEDQTRERIQDLLPEGVVDSATRMVLANALYLKAAWATPFEAAKTRPADFRRPDGSVISAQTMHAQVAARFAERAGVAALEIPYVGGEIAMLVLLPPAGELADMEAGLDRALLESLVDGLEEVRADLALPRFRVESEFSLVEAMERLGMRSAFIAGEADFSGIDGTRELFVSAIQHKTYVAVDERGTEAAAATAVVISKTSQPRQVTFTVDRPFIFLIRDIPTGTILFVGRVVDPDG